MDEALLNLTIDSARSGATSHALKIGAPSGMSREGLALGNRLSRGEEVGALSGFVGGGLAGVDPTL